MHVKLPSMQRVYIGMDGEIRNHEMDALCLKTHLKGLSQIYELMSFY